MSYKDWKKGNDDALKGIFPGGQQPCESNQAYADKLAGANAAKKPR